jgi:predicted cobalt transporter CbtA
MPLRLLAAAFAAALLATMGLMFARVATTPAGLLDTGTGDILLLRHLALGLAGGLALQIFLLYRPSTGIYRALTWGVAGFLALTLMPWLVLPDTVPGQVTARHPLRWLIVVSCTAGGLWLLWSPGLLEKSRRNRRIAGLGLILLPLLAGTFGGADSVLPAAGMPESDEAAAGSGPGPDFAVWQGLFLNLLFWLLLGVFSVLTARRIVQQPQSGNEGGGNEGGGHEGENRPGGGPGNGPGIGPGMP